MNNSDGIDLFQGYVVSPADKRLLLLFTFLKKNRNKKVMVFVSSCLCVKFYHELFNYIDLPVMSLHVSKFKPNLTNCRQLFLFDNNVGAHTI